MKLQIRLTNNDKTINIPITSRVNMLGYDDNVQSLINIENNKSINNVSDSETRIIIPSSNHTLNFRFWNGFSYVLQVAPLEFNINDFNTSGAQNSFYVIQMYDDFKEETQKKIHTGYFNGYDFAKTTLVSQYAFNDTVEFSNIYFPQSRLELMSGITTDFYVKFLFYSAKSGKFYPFYNSDAGLTTQEKLFYKISINPNNFTYNFNPNNIVLNINELTNNDYSVLVNNTITSIPIQKTTYPTGNTFTIDGVYITQ